MLVFDFLKIMERRGRLLLALPLFTILLCDTSILRAEPRRVELNNGDVYVGEIENGLRTGTGRYEWNSGYVLSLIHI